MSATSPGHATLDRSAIKNIARNALQSKSISVDALDGYIYRTFRLRTSSEGFFYLLRCRPACHVRLLRHEESWLEGEAGALLALGGRPDLLTPRLIAYQPEGPSTSNPSSHPNHPIGSAHLISGPYSGHILSDVEPTLSRASLASIDLSLGQLVRRLSQTTGPRFGSLREAQGVPASPSWARTFAFLVEALMRDGEDGLLTLPYESIRDLVRRHRAALDRISQPKLLLVEICSDRNVVVDPKSARVVGLLDFSTAVWGDPFMSDCFYKPTASFAQGYGRLPNQSAEERVRQYLYVIYHSLLAIVRQRYRPSGDGDEMEARRNLTAAMRQLSGGPR